MLAVTALASATEPTETRSTTWLTDMQANGHILGLALAGFGGSAARLVNGDGDDLKDRRQTHSSAIASSTTQEREQAITHVLHDAVVRMIEQVASMRVELTGDRDVLGQRRGILYLWQINLVLFTTLLQRCQWSIRWDPPHGAHLSLPHDHHR